MSPFHITPAVAEVLYTFLADTDRSWHGRDLIDETGVTDPTIYVILADLRRIGWLAVINDGRKQMHRLTPAGAGAAHTALKAMAGIYAPPGVSIVDRSGRNKRDDRVAYLSLLPDKPDEYLATPIDDLDLSARAYNSLRRNGINTIGDLIDRRPQELTDIRSFGESCLREVQGKLLALDLALKDDLPGDEWE
jgi:DNA-binding MarR family transcriptional regulator